METILKDIRYGLRSLLKRPGFTAIAVITLALGIAANTAIFSVINGVLLRPLNFPEPERLLVITELNPQQSPEPFELSYKNFLNYRNKIDLVRVTSCDFVDRVLLVNTKDDPRASHETTRTTQTTRSKTVA
jgi:hypothetical protein